MPAKLSCPEPDPPKAESGLGLRKSATILLENSDKFTAPSLILPHPLLAKSGQLN